MGSRDPRSPNARDRGHPHSWEVECGTGNGRRRRESAEAEVISDAEGDDGIDRDDV